MAMKWLRTAKPSVHSSRSLTALDEPLACERGTELMNAVPGKQARQLTRPMRSGGRDAAWCAHFERWYERWPLEKEEEDMRCESMYFYCVHEVVYDDDDVLTMRFLQRSTRRKQSCPRELRPFICWARRRPCFSARRWALKRILWLKRYYISCHILSFIHHAST